MPDDNLNRKKIIKISVAVLFLIIAVFFTIRGCSGAGKLSLETHSSPYICTECGYVAYCTRAERKRLIEEAAAGETDMLCSECGKIAMVTAVKCKDCGEVFPFVMTLGMGGMHVEACPECSWVPVETEQGKDDDE